MFSDSSAEGQPKAWQNNQCRTWWPHCVMWMAAMWAIDRCDWRRATGRKSKTRGGWSVWQTHRWWWWWFNQVISGSRIMTLSCAYNASIITWTYYHRGNLRLHHELNCSTRPRFSRFPINSHALSKRPYRTRVLTLRRMVNRCCAVLSWVHVSCIREESVRFRAYQKHQWNTMMQIHEENLSLCLQR